MSLAPNSADDVVKDLARGLKLIQKKQPEYQRREEYYHGERREIITHPRLRTLLDRYGDAFRLNYASVPANALIDRIDLMSLTTNDRATDALLRERLWEANTLDEDADDIHLHAFFLGDYYVVAEYIGSDNLQTDDEKDGGGETGTGVGTIELTPKHPATMVIVYQRSNSRIPDFAVQMIEGEGKGEWTALVYYDDETWEFEAEDAGDGFKVDDYAPALDESGEPDPIPNEVGLFPVFHFRPDAKPYGQPVNEKMYGPQDAITKIHATQMASMDYYGFPQRYATMDPNAEIDDDIDDDFNDDGTVYGEGEASPSRVEGRSKLSSDPGGLWMLAGVRGVGSFQPADPKGFLDPLTFEIKAGATLSRTPLYEFDLDGSAEMSGEARRRADKPITAHAAKIKGQFGGVWEAIGRYALTALSQTAATKKVVAVWAPSETSTDKEGIELVGSKIENGIPPRQALLEAGYTQAQVDEFLPVDLLNGMATPLSPKVIASLAVALRDLGQAKNLGSVNDDRIRRLFRSYFGDIADLELPDMQEARVTETIGGGGVADPASGIVDLASKADALGKLVRAGVRQEDAARILGLSGIVFDGEPVALRADSTPAP